MNNISKYVLKYNETERAVDRPEGTESVKHSVSSLMSGTLYNFTLLTVFENVSSSGKNIIAATGKTVIYSTISSITASIITLNYKLKLYILTVIGSIYTAILLYELALNETLCVPLTHFNG